MQRTGLLVAAAAALVTSVGSAQPPEKAPPLEAYAWGFPLELTGEASFYTVELPLAVNRSVSDDQLRDAGVYNGAGQPVPRVFRVGEDTVSESERREILAALALSELTEASPDDLRLMFEREGDKTVLELNASEAGSRDAENAIASYLLDTRELEGWPRELELSWPDGLPGFIGSVTIEGSSNLKDWRRLSSGAVADLREGETRVLETRVKVAAGKRRFLRLTWQDLPRDWRLSSVTAIFADDSSSTARRFTELESGGRDEDDGGYLFDLGGTPTVDRVRLVLAQPNTIVSARIFYWLEGQERWVQAAVGPHYRLGRGDASVVNKAVAMGRVRARRFKVVLERGNPGGAPRLELGWRPDRLTFLAQGEPPFVLAAGRADDRKEQFPQERLYADGTVVSLSRKGQTASAAVGERYALGGPTDLQPARVIDWRRRGLWAALVIGVGLVLWMALRVLRER